MPYNNSAIPPRKEPTGSTQLPLSRMKRIIMSDQDIYVCAGSAAFIITIATEMFIQYIAEQGHNVVKSERKPRRNIQYRDLSNAVARLDNLEFLVDVVPRTIPYKAVKAVKAPSLSTYIPLNATNGESSNSLNMEVTPVLNGNGNGNGNGLSAHIGGERAEEEGEDPNLQLEMEARRGGAGDNGNGVETLQDIEMS